MRRSRFLVLTLTVALAATGAGWYGSPAGAAVPAPTVTTIVGVSASAAAVGDTITVTASVAPLDGSPGPSVPGGVLFWASPDSATAWESGASFGPVPLVDGTASVEIELSATELPFLTTDRDDVFVAARYQPPAGDEYADSQSSPVQVVLADPTPTTPGPTATSTTVTGPFAATIGEPATFAVTVSPATAEGTVSFSVDGVPAGDPVPVVGGTASLQHTFSSAGVSTVAAAFDPTDDASYGASTDSTDVTIAKVATAVAVTGPDRAVAGARVSLTASVTPAGTAGRVSFLVDDRIVETAPVVDGTAVVTHRFLSLKDSQLSAVFKPADADSYERSTASVQLVHVVAGTTAADFTTFLSASIASLSLDRSCGDGTLAERDTPTVFSILITVFAAFFDSLREIFDMINLHYRAVLCDDGGGRGGQAQARALEGTVECRLTEAGLECPLDLAAFSQVTLTGSLPVPADLAGRSLDIGSTLSEADPVTGELTPLDSVHGTVRVPHRTVLTARLSPVRPGLESVRHGRAVSYRIAMRNAGIVRADDVRACISVGKGAKVRRAAGAQVRGRTACWTLPALGEGERAARTVTVRAPRHKDALRITALVRPKWSQGSSVRLVARLPVR